MDDIVKVNGIEYTLKEKPKTKRSFSKILPFLQMGTMMADFSAPLPTPYTLTPGAKGIPKESQISLVEEYGLIQLKKSNLSRAQRDSIEWRFERLYEKRT